MRVEGRRVDIYYTCLIYSSLGDYGVISLEKKRRHRNTVFKMNQLEVQTQDIYLGTLAFHVTFY